MSQSLRGGATTGLHASYAFGLALESYIATQEIVSIITQKMDNDDLDVTKGCQIVVTISDDLTTLKLNTTPHTPYTIGRLKLYAGVGVGVVTKEGLRPPKGYPAINPAPLEDIIQTYSRFEPIDRDLYTTISVIDGEQIATQTANSKVGVVGGISILGSTGWVKPISSSAYLDSIQAEISVALSSGYDEIVLTLGNSSLEYAQKHYHQTQIVEIGNFIYDALHIAADVGFSRAIFVCGIGKAVKVMQGHSNTHNRFGQIDFIALKELIESRLSITIDIEQTQTVKGIAGQLGSQSKELYRVVKESSKEQIEEWFPSLGIDVEVVNFK